MKEPIPFSEQLRRAIRRSEITIYRLSIAAQVDQSHLYKFLQGKRQLTTTTLDRIAAVLDLRVNIN